jgi:hypothetical protein
MRAAWRRIWAGRLGDFAHAAGDLDEIEVRFGK